ncbi:MAG TPA: MFS transporter [Rectinemataceae bacterium]|nr:MFS transporter [Rectinemataceae bacterium]
MSSEKKPLAFLSRYPLGDRATFGFDAPAAACVGVFNGLSITFIGIIGRKIGLDSHMLAILSISAFVGLFFNVWIGHLSAKGHVEAWVLVPSLIARFLVGLALVHISPWLYLGIMSAYNVVSSFGGPAYASIMRSNYSDRYRGELMGYIRVLIQVTTAISAAFAGWLMEALPDSQRLLFPVAAVFGIASSLLFFRIKIRPAEDSGRSEDGARGKADRGALGLGAKAEGGGFVAAIREIAQDRRFMVYMAIYFVIGFPDKIVVPLEPIRFVDELGMTYAEAGIIQGSIPFIGALLGYLVYAKTSDRADPFLALLVTTLLSSTRYLNTALAGNAVQLIPGAFLNGASNAGWDLIPIFSLMLFGRGKNLGFYFGFHSTLVGLRGFIGPIVGTWLYAGLGLRISTIYLIAFCLELAGAALLLPFWAALRRGGFGRIEAGGTEA